MTLKKLDDPESKAFWDYVEQSKQEWREQQPSWSRELEERKSEQVEEVRTSSQRPTAALVCN